MHSDSAISYPVMEHFYTIQGEGANTGKAAYFIRLGGCDVGCVWCDVKESWDATKHSLIAVDELVRIVQNSGAIQVVITGGEPAMYNLQPLTNQLHEIGVLCFIETSGAYPLTGTWDWICVSPKKFKAPLDVVLSKADELKVIVFNESDFNWAEKYSGKVNSSCRLFLQPEYSVFNQVAPRIVDFVKKNPSWIISLQTHKVMQIP
ncbi:MAG TPA: 7-carboxy-7-deazaguanine synthase QueE [Bacteroidia bacterium]|nr:7-carboxy-7-deazaguanine synthase QueE [Bacteroidia bacterium]